MSKLSAKVGQGNSELNTEKRVSKVKQETSSLTKMLRVLELFSAEAPVWYAIDIIKALNTSRSTGYRYVKALNAAGLLSAVGNGYYVLGPRIIELDHQIRQTDPLLQAGRGVIEQLVEATDHSALLSMLFQNSVLCIDQQLAPLSPPQILSRGQSRPLTRGAISRVILAHLPNHRLRVIYSRRHTEIAEMKLGNTWVEFRDRMAMIRSDGFARSIGEFNPGIIGIAAPVFNREHSIIGSVSIAFREEELPHLNINRTILTVKRAAHEITRRISQMAPELSLPPRAVG